jgi:hypothetical protein
VAFENMTMLRQDAEENSAPEHVITLTSREPVTDAAAYRNACAVFWRAFRRTWGHVEYCGFIEWTTGEGPRSGGKRRLHSHWLVKGLQADDLDAVQAWVSAEWAKLTGAWVVEVAELRTVGGVVGYLALHHEKASQAPPPGWTGRRLRPSRGYFGGVSGAHRRERARRWLWEHRNRVVTESGEVDEGALFAAAARGAPRFVWKSTETERGERAAVAGPGRRFDSPPAVAALDAQLRRAAAYRAAETDEDRFRRVRDEGLVLLATRSRARRRGVGAARAPTG